VPGVVLPYTPLPETSLVVQQFIPVNVPMLFLPAPLDFASFCNSLEKCVHAQSLLFADEAAFLMAVADDWYGPILAGVYGQHVPFDVLKSWIVPNTSPGFPYAMCVGTEKSVVIEKLGVPRLYDDCMTFSPVFIATLKDSLREFFKDARGFIFGGLDSIVAGAHLCGFQNQALAHACFSVRSAIGMDTPGLDFCLMWRSILHFSRNYYCADGSQWDVHFPLWGAQIICWLRLKYVAMSKRHDMRQYYRKMYWAYANALGNLLCFISQHSGQYNTAADNDILEHLNVWLYCFHACIPLDQILFYTCGDDIVISCDHPNFSVAGFLKCSVDHGIFLEFQSLAPVPFTSCVFCGTHPVFSPVDGVVYTYNEPTQLSSLLWHNEQGSASEYFAKLTAIAGNLYYSPSFFYVERLCLDYYSQVLHGASASRGCMRSVLRFLLVRRYLNIEAAVSICKPL
jgi:hypothetical protein